MNDTLGFLEALDPQIAKIDDVKKICGLIDEFAGANTSISFSFDEAGVNISFPSNYDSLKEKREPFDKLLNITVVHVTRVGEGAVMIDIWVPRNIGEDDDD